MSLRLNWMAGFLFAVLAVLLVAWGFSLASVSGAGRYNVVTNFVRDGGSNLTNYPKCDSGDNWFLSYFVEWERGRQMVAGLQCVVRGISASKIAELVDRKLLSEGIDPATASPEEVEIAESIVLQEWFRGIIP